MTGETEEQPSAWTVDMLAQHISRIFIEHDRRYEQRFEAQEKAVSAALVSADRAGIKAEVAVEKRLDSVNEFRGQLADQAATFMPRLEYEARHAAILDKTADIQARLDKAEAHRGGMSAAIGTTIAAAGVLVALVAIAAAVLIR